MAEQHVDAASLARLAKAATDEVRAEAIKNGELLPVWNDERIGFEDPKTGKIVHRKDSLSAQREEVEKSLDAVADLEIGIVEPGISKTLPTGAAG